MRESASLRRSRDRAQDRSLLNQKDRFAVVFPKFDHVF